ncbi:MAG: hypothetical protein Q8O56_02160 [Solirubrobacteraceae bacterium]|nr:hypothetical protein [Solirubrobacteraceae bacterium]
MTIGGVDADAVDGLTVADVMHGRCDALPASASVADVRAWFSISASRRLALLADGERYVGSLTPADVAGDVDARRPVLQLARRGATLAPDTAAAAGRDLVLASPARRLPVVDDEGLLVGVLALTTDRRRFACRDVD